MKLQRQGRDECLLVSLAMVVERKIEDLRLEVSKKYGCTWSTLAHSGRYTAMIELLNQCGMVWNNTILSGIAIESSSNEQTSFAGRGIIIVRSIDLKKRHAMAYESGMIYDPNAKAPMTRQEWMAWHPDHYGYLFKFERIIPANPSADK